MAVLISILAMAIQLNILMPANAYANDAAATAVGNNTVLAFASDVHNKSDNIAANRLSKWIDLVIKKHGKIDAMGFCGDIGSGRAKENDFWNYTQSVMDVVDKKGIKAVYTTGNHEFKNGNYSGTSNPVAKRFIVDAEGSVGDNYLIYCLGTENWDNSTDNYTTDQISKLRKYLTGASADKPIIVLTHFPLHYYKGSQTRKTKNADQVIDVLNEASNAGKKIVLLWCHNHTISDINYDEIYQPGSIIEYSSGNNKEIRFYYGSAGCMSDSEYGTGSAYVKGKGLVMTIDSNDKLAFIYYDANGNNVYGYSEPLILPADHNGLDGTPAGKGASYRVAERAILTATTDEGPAGTKYAPLKLKSTKQTKTSITLKWTKVKGAAKYVIYGNKCGSSNKMKKLARVTGKSKTFQTVAGTKIAKGKYYKFIILALDKNNLVVSTSKVVHVASKGGKVGNYKSVSIKKSVLTKAKKLKAGKKLKLNAKSIRASKLKVKIHRTLRYESTNTSVAEVTKKGIIKTKKKGTCYVYAYGQNGVSKAIKVTVK